MAQGGHIRVLTTTFDRVLRYVLPFYIQESEGVLVSY